MEGKYVQADFGSDHDGFQSIMFNKTPLDTALEVVEHRYGSITKAPEVAVKYVRRAAEAMGLHVGSEYHHANTVKYRPINSRLLNRRVTPIPATFKFWKDKDGRYCTNYMPLVNVIKYIHKGYSPIVACKLGNFSHTRFKRFHLQRKGYRWDCGNIHQRVYSIPALIKYCKSLNWHFGPTSYNQWTFHDYKGKITPYNYYVSIRYRKGK